LFRRSPFKDAEVNPEPPQLDFQDRVRLTYAFLMFYHRIVIAVILLAGLGYWIYYVADAPRDVAKSANLEQPDPIELPSASLEFSPKKETSSGVTSPATVDAAVDAAVDADNETASRKSAEPNSASDRLIATGTVSELIEEALNIRGKVGKNSSIVDFMWCSRRAKISRRLLEMELTPKQREFALVSYIESISMVDSLNVQGQLNVAGPREALMEVAAKYSDHPNPTVKTKVSLAITLVPAYDFLVSGQPELLEKFTAELERRADQLINDQPAAARLLTTAVFLNDKPGFETLTWPVALKVLQTFEKTTSPNVKQLVVSFRERLYFGKLDLDTLVDRIDVNDSRSRADVQKFYESLVVNPDSRPKIYATAVAVIQRYQELGRENDVQALIKWLRDICATMTDDQQRQEVLTAIDELEQN
jgi:hypothetical protein